MTITVKLDPPLEERLRQRAAAAGLTTSDVVRQALAAWLAAEREVPTPSPYTLGSDLFGRHRGAPDLARDRKALVADAWAGKHGARR